MIPKVEKPQDSNNTCIIELQESVCGERIIEVFKSTAPERTVDLLQNQGGLFMKTANYTLCLSSEDNSALDKYMRYKRFLLRYFNEIPMVIDEVQDQFFGYNRTASANNQLQILATLMRVKLIEGVMVNE